MVSEVNKTDKRHAQKTKGNGYSRHCSSDNEPHTVIVRNCHAEAKAHEHTSQTAKAVWFAHLHSSSTALTSLCIAFIYLSKFTRVRRRKICWKLEKQG